MVKKFFSKLLLGKYLGSVVRHILTGAGGFLVAKGLADLETVTLSVNSLEKLLTSQEMIEGVSAFVLGWGSSVAEKKTR